MNWYFIVEKEVKNVQGVRGKRTQYNVRKINKTDNVHLNIVCSTFNRETADKTCNWFNQRIDNV